MENLPPAQWYEMAIRGRWIRPGLTNLSGGQPVVAAVAEAVEIEGILMILRLAMSGSCK